MSLKDFKFPSLIKKKSSKFSISPDYKAPTPKTPKTPRGRLFQINIGSVVFFCILVYIICYLYLYISAPNIKTYMVVQGPLAQNQTYTAFAIRNEQEVTSISSGYLHFFVNNKTKVSKDSIIYGISDSPWTESQLQINVDESVLNSIRSSLSSYSTSFDQINADGTAEFKYELTQKLLTESEVQISSSAIVKSASTDGLVVLGVDGYEAYTAEMLNDDVFSKRRTIASLNVSNQYINVGDPVYKLILDDSWSIAIPINAKEAVSLQSLNTIKVKFLKDGKTLKGKLTIAKNSDEQYFGVISFTSGMIRYASDRFLDIELVTNSETGLKIPVSAVTQKEFFKIPASLLAIGGDNSNDTGFLRYVTNSKGEFVMDEAGNPTTEFVEAVLYASESDEEGNVLLYYVDMNTFSQGDVLIGEESGTTFIVETTGNLQGVYCVNKGYTVFRHIDIIDQNAEYCIVRSGTRYGISQFDYIVEDAKTVYEQEILRK